VECHEPLRVRIGEGAKDDSINEREDGAGSSNSNGQRQGDRRRKPAAFRHHAKSVPQVTNPALEAWPSPGVAAILEDQLASEDTTFDRFFACVGRLHLAVYAKFLFQFRVDLIATG
jgi:hypothetical protein